MRIGNFGRVITFQVSDAQVMTPKTVTKEVSAKWTEHNSIGEKDVSEYLGPGLASMKMPVILCASLGVSPKKVLKKMERACESGDVERLVIGGRNHGLFCISSMSEAWDYVFVNGEIYQATVELTFKEYGE